MSDFIHCPSCHARAYRGGFFNIFQCKKCGELYCYLCPGTNEGKRCPSCDNRDYSIAGKCCPR
jgi:hypothetical protein